MQKSILLYIIALIQISFSVQAQEDYTSISGSILNKSADYISIVSKDFKTYTKVIMLTDLGKFEDTLKVKQGFYYFFDGKSLASVYLKPGNKIIVNVDSKDFNNTIAFIGDGSLESMGLRKYETAKEKLKQAFTPNYKLSEDAFKIKSKEIKLELEQVLASITTIPIDTRNAEKQNLQYEYLDRLNYYEQMIADATKNPDFKVSNGFLDELKEITYDREDDFNSFNAYKNLVTAHYNRIAKVLSEKESIQQDLAKIEVISKIQNETIKNYLSYAAASIDLAKTEDFTVYYNAFIKVCTNERFNQEISATYRSLTFLKKGRVAPKFVNYENHAGGTTSLDDLKGKYVYIDVWATWCAPCIKEVPYLQQLEKEYHGKNITFVSVSIDSDKDHEKWKKMVVDLGMVGMQLYASEEFTPIFKSDFGVITVPHFILIDPNGNIVDAKAPLPSQKELKELFNSLDI